MDNTPLLALPHTKESVPLTLILALWHEMALEWLPLASPMAAAIPVLNVAATLHASLAMPATLPTGRAWSLDVLCRVASRRCDTMQATPQLFAANTRWLGRLASGEFWHGQALPVNHARLTDDAVAFWENLPVASRDDAIGAARRLLESDIESAGVICSVLPLARAVPVGAVAAAAMEGVSLAASLVAQIHGQAFQPQYRKQTYGAPLHGWPQRLQGYFWPAPEQGYRQVAAGLASLLDEAQALAQALRHARWDGAQGQRAVALAHGIFAWGGVKQDPATVTAANVERVFADALANNAASTALMNSGWTKVAAFATAHLEADGLPQVIWDSRVATSLISRLDRLLPAGRAPADDVPGIGTVPGRGGSRPRQLQRSWPSGYQRWDAQVAGSALVRDMRDVLNDPALGYAAMPLPRGGSGPWTTRGVEMVLFMDGY